MEPTTCEQMNHLQVLPDISVSMRWIGLLGSCPDRVQWTQARLLPVCTHLQGVMILMTSRNKAMRFVCLFQIL